VALFEVNDLDRQIYRDELAAFLPEKMIDIHTHVWLNSLKKHADNEFARVVSWPSKVAADNPIEDHLETYRLMFPDKEVTPMIFSSIKKGDDIDGLNTYISESAQKHQLPALIYAPPWWTAEELDRKLTAGGFLGIKVYLNLSPDYIPMEEIRIFDFLPHHFLQLLDDRQGIVMLHIPRNGRLKDPVNLAQMLEIEENYPRLKLIIAHVGRAYCDSDIGNAFEVLKHTRNMLWDFSANTNAVVFQKLLESVGPQRVLFGSDLPILRMRMRRICENEHYINIVPRGLYGDVSGDPNMREVDSPEADRLTFFMYEELLAFKKAAAAVKLSAEAIENIFYLNAKRVIESVPKC
jgi:uncharacterized protein